MFISRNIKHLRKLKSFTTKEMAAFLGTSQSTISRYETEGSEPAGDTVARIGEAFGLPVEILLKEDLSLRWATWAELEGWKKREEDARAIAQANIDDLAVASYKIDALIEHYSKFVSQMTGKESKQVEEEVQLRFEEKVFVIQQALKGTAYDAPHDE